MAGMPDDARDFSYLPGMVYRCLDNADWTMIFVSDGCRDLLNIDPEQLLSGRLSFVSLVHPEDLQHLRKAIEDALQRRAMFDVEYRIQLPDGAEKWVWERGRALPECVHGVGVLQGFITDISSRKRAEGAALREAAFRELILELSTRLIHLPYEFVDSVIHDALAQIGQFFMADRAYVFAYDLTRKVASNTHEWCAEGIEPQIAHLQNVPFRELEEVVEIHLRGEPLLLPDVSNLPQGRLKRHLEAQSIRSLLTYPILLKGRCIGFVGLDAVTAHADFGDNSFALLALFGNLLANLQRRRIQNQTLRLYKSVIDQSAEGITFTDLEGYVLFVNPAWATLHGYHSEDLPGQHLKIFHTPVQLQEEVLPIKEAILLTGEPFRGEVGHCRRDGSAFPAFMTTTLVRDGDGKPIGLLAQMRDITDAKRVEQRLRQAANVFDHAGEGIVITDKQARILDVNRAFTEITGYPRDELIGKNPRLLQSGRHGAAFYKRMWRQLRRDGQWCGELWNRRKSGEVYPERLLISAIRDDRGEISQYVGMISDITVLKKAQRQLEQMAYFDPLTNLPNRVLLQDRLQQLLSSIRRKGGILAIAYIDLDGFKAVNDRFDHHLGDRLLVALSLQMKEMLREGDTLARVGGDEFVAVLTGLESHEDACGVAQRLLMAANLPVVLDGHPVQVSASIGVVNYPLSDELLTPEALLRCADRAMYLAKQAGKNQVRVFDFGQTPPES